MHPAARKFCVEHAWQTEKTGNALDIGGRNINGHVRDLWPKMSWTIIDSFDGVQRSDSYDYLDKYIIDNAIGWEPGCVYDLVICTEVFEHCEQWPELIKTAYRCLSLEGHFIITCAGPGRKAHSGFDGGTTLYPGEYYGNIIPDVLGRVLKDCGFYGFVIYNPYAFDNYVFAKKV